MMKRLDLTAVSRCLLAAALGAALAATATPAFAATRAEQAAMVRERALATSSAYALLSDLTTTVGQRLAGTEAEARGLAKGARLG